MTNRPPETIGNSAQKAKEPRGESREEFERDRGFVPRDANGEPTWKIKDNHFTETREGRTWCKSHDRWYIECVRTTGAPDHDGSVAAEKTGEKL